MKILLSKRFVRQIRKLPEPIQWLADEKRALFAENPLDPRLKTHKLHGEFSGLWAISIDHQTRAIFELIGNDTALFHSIGGHKIYD